MLTRGPAIKGILLLGVALLASPAHAATERERSRREFFGLLLLLEKNADASQTPVVATSNSIVAQGVTATPAAISSARTVSKASAAPTGTTAVHAESLPGYTGSLQVIRRLVLQEYALTAYGMLDVRAQNAAINRLASLERLGVTTPRVEAAIARQEAAIAATQTRITYDAGLLFMQEAAISQAVSSLAPILQGNPAGAAIIQRVIATEEAAAVNAYRVIVRGSATPSS